MAVSVSPRPGDGPLSAKGPTIKLSVTATSLTTVTVSILTPSGDYLAIDDAVVFPGSTTLILSIPPGVPPGSVLNVFAEEQDGSVTTHNYKLK